MRCKVKYAQNEEEKKVLKLHHFKEVKLHNPGSYNRFVLGSCRSHRALSTWDLFRRISLNVAKFPPNLPAFISRVNVMLRRPEDLSDKFTETGQQTRQQYKNDPLLHVINKEINISICLHRFG